MTASFTRKEKQVFAIELRQGMTDAERVLLAAITNHDHLRRFPWRTQHILLGWIVDFWCEPFKLVVEADGGYHLTATQKEKDRHRDKAMKEAGITVLRFRNEDIEVRTRRVLGAIHRTIRSIGKRLRQDGKVPW